MPYPGLRPFESEDHPLFFGREAQVEALLRRLEDHRFVAVVGSSGSGKSSLVRAGLLPAVHEGFIHGSSSWLSMIVKPGHQPYARLGGKLHDVIQAGSGALRTATAPGPEVRAEAVVATLRRTDRGLLEALASVGVPPDTNVMVVVDQFEEIFAFRRANASRDEVASRDESAAFVRMLLHSSSDPKGRVWVVLTMRSDFIGDCEAFLGLPEAVSRSQFLVPRLDREQMEEAIRRPGEVKGAGFRPFTFENGLVNRIINEAGDRPDQLPLLQHALMRAWKYARKRADEKGGFVELTHDDYEEAGGIENALSRHADAAWRTIANDQGKAELARRLFLLLCDISPDGQITRRRPRVAEVEAVTRSDVAEIEEVVRLFQDDDRNFLLPPQGEDLSSETCLEVSHEALLRRWRLFANDWLVQERSDADELRTLAKQANDRVERRGGLLGEQDLERIRKWRNRISPQWALRYVKRETWDELLAFIQESENEAERQRKEQARQAQVRRWLWGALGGVLVVAALVCFLFAIAAHHEADNARRQSVNSIVRPIGVNRYWSESEGEQEALWQLAEMDPANQAVRQQVIKQWMKAGDSLSRALINNGLGLHAAMGLKKSLRAFVESQASDGSNVLAKAIEESSDTYRLQSLGETMAALAPLMSPADAAAMAARLATALEKAQGSDGSQLSALSGALAALASRMNTSEAAIVAARGGSALAKALEFRQDKDSYPVTLGEAWEALATHINTNDAAAIAARLATGLEEGRDRDSPGRLTGLGEGLAALAPRMRPTDAATLAARLAGDLEERREHDYFERLSGLGKGLAAMAARMNTDDAATLAARGGSVLALWMNAQDHNPKPLETIGEGLAALAERMNTKDAASMAGREALVLATVEERRLKRDSSYGEGDVSNALAALAPRLSPADAATMAVRLATAIVQQKDLGDLWGLDPPLAALAARMSPADAATLAARLATALENGQAGDDSDRLSTLGRALAALAAQMSPADAAAMAARLATALERLQGWKRDRLSALGEALAGPAARMSPADAATMAARLATAVERLQGTEKDGLSDLCEALAGLAARMSPADAATMASRLATALEKLDPKDVNRLSALGEVFAALAARMDTNNAAMIAARGGLVLANALEKMQEGDPDRSVAVLRRDLAALAVKIPKAKKTRLAALSLLFLTEVPGPPKHGETEAPERTTTASTAALLTPQELAEALKWPYCVGEGQKLLLAELGKKTRRDFGGDVWKFVEQADSLGIRGLDREFLDLPAKRPKIEDAVKELQSFIPSADKRL
jgi:energy-coupling factor transporter ATP-binding protein EcfA2